MIATTCRVADAVLARIVLERSTLVLPFETERLFVPVHELDELDRLVVSIVPSSAASTLLTRGASAQRDHVVQVGVQRRVDPTNDVLDQLVVFVDELAAVFLGRSIEVQTDVGMAPAWCVAAGVDPLCARDHLDERRVFTSVVSLTFRMCW